MTSNIHVMVDIEGLSTDNDAPMSEIGAVKYNPKTGECFEEFEVLVDIEDSMRYSQPSATTIKFWMKQSDEARSHFNEKGLPLDVALINLSEWLQGLKDAYPSDDVKLHVWGNGVNYDNVVLCNAYKKVGLEVPWDHYSDEHVRTIVTMGREILGIDPKKEMVRKGTYHRALDDAKFQVGYVSEIWQAFERLKQGTKQAVTDVSPSQFKSVGSLTQNELACTVTHLVKFYDFTFFSERECDVSTGLVYALEMQAIMLGLIPDNWGQRLDLDCSDIMEELVTVLHRYATENKIAGWQAFASDLPYMRSAESSL
ncbi:3'-5' exonuclease [Photobacterium leiognathi]|uniref:3'-5' exonuclease n=1 Tax=Photobacterium leiognathi TaxID=553611 RepID=UPI0029824127|nr:3'-5' exonuclease [Photobacterium leiognathi]